MNKPRKPLVAPRVYSPLEDFDPHPLTSAAVLSDRAVAPCYLPMIYGVGRVAEDGVARVLWRKVYKRKRGAE